MDNKAERRKYIRHPLSAPIILQEQNKPISVCTQDISIGGLLFISKNKFPPDATLQITIPGINKQSSVSFTGCISHTHYNSKKKYYEIGIRFLDSNEMNRVRMVEQLVRIENYREKNKIPDFETAAQEWIQKHARSFAQPLIKEAELKDMPE